MDKLNDVLYPLLEGHRDQLSVTSKYGNLKISHNNQGGFIILLMSPDDDSVMAHKVNTIPELLEALANLEVQSNQVLLG